jgi:hypothetical protein
MRFITKQVKEFSKLSSAPSRRKGSRRSGALRIRSAEGVRFGYTETPDPRDHDIRSAQAS